MRSIKHQMNFAITIDYSLPFRQMADLSNCSLEKGLNEYFFPVIGSGCRRICLGLVDFFDLSPLGPSLGNNGCFFGQIEHAFFFAARFPEEQYKCSLIFPGSILTDSSGRRFCPLLTSLVGGRNIVKFDLDNPLSVYHRVAVIDTAKRY